MADVVTPEVRSRMMSGIRGADTAPEIRIRKALFARGFRYRKNDRRLPGKPDIVLPRHSAVIFVHGCFWHGHECRIFKWPTTRKAFWRTKITGNRIRDQEHTDTLLAGSWRVATLYECALRGPDRQDFEALIARCVKWIYSEKQKIVIPNH